MLHDAIDLRLNMITHHYREAIPGFEVGAAVYGVGELIVGEIDEIELDHDFLTFLKISFRNLKFMYLHVLRPSSLHS